MGVATYLNITAFDISPTDIAGVSQLFIMNRTNIAYTFTVNGTNFDVLESDTPADHSVQIISSIQEYDQYLISTSVFQSLQFIEFDKV